MVKRSFQAKWYANGVRSQFEFFLFGFPIRPWGKGEGECDAMISHIKYFDEREATIYCDKCNDVVPHTLLIHHIGIANIIQKLMATIFPKQAISAFDTLRPNSTVPLAHKIPYVTYIYVFIWFWPMQTTNWTNIYIDPWVARAHERATQIAIHICGTCWRLFIGTLQRFIKCHVIGMAIWQTAQSSVAPLQMQIFHFITRSYLLIT